MKDAKVRLDALRQEAGTVDKTPDKLTIVTNQMAALADELKQLDGAAPRRDEIAQQLKRLGRLYLAIRSNSDLSDEDR